MNDPDATLAEHLSAVEDRVARLEEIVHAMLADDEEEIDIEAQHQEFAAKIRVRDA